MKQRVVITGMAGRLGRVVTEHLHRQLELRLVGLDRRPFPDRPKDVDVVAVDLRSGRARDVFRGGDVAAVIHLGIMHDPRASNQEVYSWNIGGTSKLLEYCQTYKVPKFVLLSSANVYGPRHDNPQFLTEDAPLLAAQRFPQMRDLVEIDHLVSTFFWKAQAVETVILRPVHILGNVRNAPSNYLRLNPAPVLLGFDPMIQCLHQEDAAEAILRALAPGTRGIYNIAGPGELPLSIIFKELGHKTIAVPHGLAGTLWSAAFRLGISSYPVAEFDFIRYICMVDGSRAERELGFRARKTLRETIRAVLAP